jgi:hypothetical protein
MSRGATRRSLPALLPCPFCGGKAQLQEKHGSREWWMVRCERYLCGGTTWAMDDLLKAVGAWNQRLPNGQE